MISDAHRTGKYTRSLHSYFVLKKGTKCLLLTLHRLKIHISSIFYSLISIKFTGVQLFYTYITMCCHINQWIWQLICVFIFINWQCTLIKFFLYNINLNWNYLVSDYNLVGDYIFEILILCVNITIKLFGKKIQRNLKKMRDKHILSKIIKIIKLIF